MRFAEPGVALPIGNLTSQLFSNVYLNVFDQFIKRDIKCHHYGRYVDDSVQIDSDREWLIQQVPREREFLADELGLQLHMGKLHIREVRQGVEFLGAFLKPYRDYVSNKTLERMTKKIQEIDLRNEDKAVRTIDSYLGILSHTSSRCITKDLMSKPLAA